jgi:hypothetical protein
MLRKVCTVKKTNRNSPDKLIMSFLPIEESIINNFITVFELMFIERIIKSRILNWCK